MAYTTPTVNYSATMDGTYTTITGVQSVTFNRGRHRFIDPFPPTSCVIELIPANSYALPFEVGQYIDVRPSNSGSSEAFFVGEITDIQRTYDIPYDAITGAAPGDRITITALGPMGLIGRMEGNDINYSVLETTSTVANMIRQTTARHFNVNANNFVVTSASNLVQSQQSSNAPLDVLNKYAASDPRYLADRDNARLISTRPSGSGYVGIGPVEFQITQVGQMGDDGNAFACSDSGGGYKYTAIEYGTGAENTFSQVNVIVDNVDGDTDIPTQTVSSGFAPFSSLNWETYLETSDFSGLPYEYASNLANYIFSRSYVTTAAPFSLGFSTNADDTITDLAKMNTIIPGLRGTITFRGSTYRVTLEGIEATFGLESATVRAYFSPFPLNVFVLNSANNGVLDVNELGFP